jgi:Zierdtviridae DNA polymerase
MKFVSLHHHSTYSFLDGFGTPDQHAARAAELGYTAMALTEHGNSSSHFRFERAAEKAGIKPIFGLEAYTAPTDGAEQQIKWHLIVLAENQEGYRNLNRAVTQSWRDFYYHPTLLGGTLAEFRDGLYVLSGCSGSLLACHVIGGKGITAPEGNPIRATQPIAERFADVFGSHYYLEVQAFPELPGTHAINQHYEKLSRATGIPIVATLDVHYPLPADNEIQLTLHACGRGNETAEGQARKWNYDVRLTLPESDRDIRERLEGTGLSRRAAMAAMANTATIADACNVTLPKAERLRFPCPPGWDATSLIWQWLRDGWKYRGLGRRTRKEQDWYHDRIMYEMKLITDKDFIDFFLATADVVSWAKDNGIPVGPGRGSAAASLVCWLLRITEIDPGRYPGMIFERFLDVNRFDPPDIDLDFADDERYRVREYLERRYGTDCVGTIANFIRYRGKNALVDVARVHGIPKGAKEVVANLIIERSGGDSRFDATLVDTVEMFPNAQAVFKAYPKLWLATRLEGNVRGMSVHAAGLVVANSPLTDICAVYERDGRQVLSIDKYDVDSAGMLKMDFLGLTTMGMIARCLELTGLTLEDLYAVPDDDAATLDVFRRGDVVGIFQFEGRATRIVNRDVVPDSFAEVADINALARPGPLFSGTTAEYVDVKHGRRKAERYHPIVDEITRDTYGQIIYQEQILRILLEIAGFPWTELGEIRRIISKKLGQAAMNVSMENFVAGAERLHGIKRETAEKIWKRIVTSGTYSFNIAHAISYSMLAWWCAYLKAHYPAEFYAASLAKSAPSSDSEFKLLRDAEKHGIAIMPPDYRLSDVTWRAVMPQSQKPAVLAGFSSVPGIGDKIAERIVAGRKTQPFTNWNDMLRVPGIGEKKVESIRQFASRRDPFGLHSTERILNLVKAAIKDREIRAPMPTWTGEDVAELEVPWNSRAREWLKGPRIVWAGIVKYRNYQDTIENIHSRTGDDLEDIRKRLKRPDLVTSCVLVSYDHTQEEVYLRVNRFTFPKFKAKLESIAVGHDVVIAIGRKTAGFGSSIAVENFWVVDPDDDD